VVLLRCLEIGVRVGFIVSTKMSGAALYPEPPQSGPPLFVPFEKKD
jgi:hypothetical protein